MRGMDRRVRRVAERRPRPISSADIINSPAWWELRGATVTALRPYPEAKAAVAEALRPLGAYDPEEPGRRSR